MDHTDAFIDALVSELTKVAKEDEARKTRKKGIRGLATAGGGAAGAYFGAKARNWASHPADRAFLGTAGGLAGGVGGAIAGNLASRIGMRIARHGERVVTGK